jgi:ADP-ribosylglycohydrolase
MSVRAAITSLMKNDSLAAILKSSIAWGGDTDTVATIALAAGSCCDEIKQDLPDNLLHKLENSQYGHSYLSDLDKKLERIRKDLHAKGR